MIDPNRLRRAVRGGGPVLPRAYVVVTVSGGGAYEQMVDFYSLQHAVTCARLEEARNPGAVTLYYVPKRGKPVALPLVA